MSSYVYIYSISMFLLENNCPASFKSEKKISDQPQADVRSEVLHSDSSPNLGSHLTMLYFGLAPCRVRESCLEPHPKAGTL